MHAVPVLSAPWKGHFPEIPEFQGFFMSRDIQARGFLFHVPVMNGHNTA